MASKFEDIYPLSLSQIQQLSGFEKSEIIKKEQIIFTQLNFKILKVTSLNLAEVLLKFNKINNKKANRLCELIVSLFLFYPGQDKLVDLQVAEFAMVFALKIAQKDAEISTSLNRSVFFELLEVLKRVFVQMEVQELGHLRGEYGRAYSDLFYYVNILA